MYRTRSFRESEVDTSYHVSKGRSVNFLRERPGSLYTLVHVDTRETDRRGWEHRLSQAGVALKWRISPRRCDRPPVTKRNYARQEMHYRSSPQPPEHSLSPPPPLSPSLPRPIYAPPPPTCAPRQRITPVRLDGPRKSSNRSTRSIRSIRRLPAWQRTATSRKCIISFYFSHLTLQQ